MFIVPITRMLPMEEVAKAAEAVVTPAKVPFKDVLGEAYNNLIETQAISRQDAYDLAMGKTDDLHTMMINSEKSATALEMTVQLTTRAVAAYNEVMRMQV